MAADGSSTIDLRDAADMVMRDARSGRETGGELLDVEVLYGGRGPASPKHIHEEQEEFFNVHS